MNEVEFRRLILAELDAVHRLACHLTRGRVESDDCVQETYLRALKSRATFTLAAHGVRPWLFKILHNVIIARASRAKREREVLDELPFASPAREPCEEISGGAIDWEQVDERLKLAIAELPLVYRSTFLLSVLEGLRYREIAEVTEVPIGTVTSRLARARAALALRLADVAGERRLSESIKAGDETRGGTEAMATSPSEQTNAAAEPIDDVMP